MIDTLSERGFRWLFDAAVDAMLIADCDGRILLANPAAEELFGYPAEEFSGLTIEDLVPQRYRARHREHRADYARSPRRRAMGSGLEISGLRKDGSEFACEISLGPMQDSLVLATVHDVEARRRIEQALRQSEERLRLALTASNTRVWTWDIAAGAVTYLVPSQGREYRYESLGDFLAEVHSQDRDRVRAAFMRSAATGADYQGELRVWEEGEVRWFLCRGVVQRDAQGRPAAMIGVRLDITERKRSELELRELRAEMEQLLQLHVARLTAAAIAHELNQPLNAVASYNEAALRLLRAGNPDPDKLARAVESSVQQMQRAGQIMRDLIDFLHRGEAVTEPVDLNGVVRECVAILQADGYDDFEVVLDLAPDLPPVRANRVQVGRVLVSLLRNGVEAMRSAGLASGHITVRVRTAAGEKVAQVTVRDTGPGVDPRALERIFQPFYTTKPKGIGMGLAISRALIEAQGGQLWVESGPGPGASFHFTVPLIL